MTIKKAYVELIAFLEANEGKKVKTILAEVKEMCEAKNSSMSDTGTTFLKDENDEVTAIFCYYFKKWMPLCDVEFGAKKNTASGYNTMCKSGVSAWTKQQRQAKKELEVLLGQVGNGEVTVEQLPEVRAELEAARKRIIKCEEINFATSKEVLAYINEPISEVNTETED